MATRRDILKIMGALSASALIAPSFAKAAGAADKRFVLIILRGALDGLSAAPPFGDPAYAGLRGKIAVPKPGGENGALDLDGFFGLHPAFAELHRQYQAGEAILVHAAATPYRSRSHFDGQDVLENGTARPLGASDGWLNRALAALPGEGAGPRGLALGQAVPLVLRGSAKVSSWAPSVLPPVDSDTVGRLMDLYAGDTLLGPALADALATNALAEGGAIDGAKAMQAGLKGGTGRRADVELARMAGKLLSDPDGPNIAVLDMGGFDTHANEAGLLAIRLAGLDATLAVLKSSLGPMWAKTAGLAITEFGRTAALNGTGGTDHGTASAAFIFGGAISGGRVIADWSGLQAAALYEGRDVKPTVDLRAVAKGLLGDHLGLSASVLGDQVFPDSAGVRPLGGLIRA